MNSTNPYAPGPRGHWWWGNLKDQWEDPIGFFRSATQLYGDTVRLRFGRKIVHLFNSPETAAVILKTNAGNFPKLRSPRPLLGEGLLTSEGEHWRNLRSATAPEFGPAAIRKFSEVVDDCAEKTIAAFPTGRTFDAFPRLRDFALAVATRTLFGVDDADLRRNLDEHLQWILAQGRRRNHYLLAPYYRTGFKKLQYESRVRELGNIVDTLVDDSAPDTAIGRFRGDPQWTPRQIRDQAATLILTGYETTANVLAFAVAEVAQLKPNQRIVPAYELPAFIDEVLRCYPPGWLLVREVRVPTTVGGYALPAGSWVAVSPYLLQRDPRHWERPDEFLPGRFADRTRKPVPFSFIPFGAGPRQCVGSQLAHLELTSFLRRLFVGGELRAAARNLTEVDPLLVLRPRNPLLVRID